MIDHLSDKTRAKLNKLLALAERGIGGEKTNARRMLEKMLQQHGLTILDLSEERRKMYWFPCPTTFERRLAAQIFAKIRDDYTTPAWTQKNRQKQVGIKATPAEAIEFEIHYEALRKALREHFSDAYSAFVQANKIYPATNNHHDEAEEITERDIRIASIAAATPSTPIHQRISFSEDD